MSYNYQSDDMDALRVTFISMLEDINDLRQSLSDADDANLELYDEANELEAELDRLREMYDQDMFDAAEDYVELERSYNQLADKYIDLHDWIHDEDFVDFLFQK